MFLTSSDLALSLPHALSASPRPSTSAPSSSSSGSSGTSTQSTSPTLYDLPTPPSLPISTPSPLGSSLPFVSASPPLHALEAFETSLSGLPDWSATIDPSLLFGLDPASTASSKAPPYGGAQAAEDSSSSAPTRSFFPPGSPIQTLSEREQQRSVPLFGESTTPEQRREQIAALSSLIMNGPAPPRPSSSGPVKRTRSAKNAEGRGRSMSQGRLTSGGGATLTAGASISRRASVNAEASSSSSAPYQSGRSTSPARSPSRSWLDALREAEAKAKLKRMQGAAAATSGAPRGRLALMHGQLLAQSMQAEAQGMSAAASVPPTGGGVSVFPWGHL